MRAGKRHGEGEGWGREGGEGNERKRCDHSKIWVKIGATNIIKNHTTITTNTLHRHALMLTCTLPLSSLYQS